MRSRKHDACEREIQRLLDLTVRQAVHIRELERSKAIWLKLAVHLARQQNDQKQVENDGR
jgi:hypothetical protein